MSSSPDGCPVFWFTGLSGAGKTTIAEAVQTELNARGLTIVILDGDEVRRRRAKPLGFSRCDVLTNNAEIAALCVTERGRADAILVPIISPYAEGRTKARELIGPEFFEIHFSADKDCVAARDPKGLYAKAAKGEIPAMIGFDPSAPYEPPMSPDLSIDTAEEGAEQSVEKFTRFLLANL